MKKEVSLSIVIPVYNAEPYLVPCVESIFKQTFSDYELILVDDGSTDRSGELCDELAKGRENVLVLHTENQGPAPARNLGLSRASGTYLGFVDQDDLVHPQMFEILMEEALSGDFDVVACGFESFSSENPPEVQSINKEEVSFRRLCHREFITDFWNEAYLKLGVPQWTNIFRTSMLKKIGICEKYFYYEDLNTQPAVLENSTRTSYTEYKLYYYRSDNSSIVRSSINPKKIDKLGSWKNILIPFLERNCDAENIKKGYQMYITRYENIAYAICEDGGKIKKIPREYRRYLLHILRRLGLLKPGNAGSSVTYYLLLLVSLRAWSRYLKKKNLSVT